MRVKKQKQVRRHVRFFKACCGFREPFKVLCDGNFVHAALTARMGGLQDALPNFLGSAAKAFVTRCVIQELRKLGEVFSGTVLAARRLDIAKCNHEPPVSAAECVEAMIGKNNPEHFFVATQDFELRKRIRKVPGGGIIFAQNTGLIMEPPSTQQVAYARMSEAERAHMAEREQKIIEERARRKAEAALAAKTAQEAPADLHVPANEQKPVLKDRTKLKRKLPKGPNPLSQKKKKMKVTESNTSAVKIPSAEEGADASTKRQRHRVRRRKSSVTNEKKDETD
ncbi:U3 small nucleolar RNA-associated protein 23 [Marchantia polymorpha subsp. ruderalis]|uniref:PIN domain-containing protein n=2 Tax=Marchantia polymorpha TaxID=3197 RepID=A0A176WSW8_MARPO|nr:hypothetical protein AXG93_1356s1170 [Marchantia polymorpha subsp. ruderalis]PTQ47991.1 hypothetical protein MARPO_0006s0036 [Marchantia polymorpha]BBN04553.1 hypothetical protein Mp_3g05640 [Marchantia polymorpha subsp. ruderalis]|eukprot:PTQ47991.1 hypothetical protein MARPO_0006s0036 [Marchantia polymorpha]